MERTAEVFPTAELPALVAVEPSSILVAEHMGEYVAQLAEAFSDSEDFQYKLTPIYRDSHGKGKGRAVLRDTVTSLIGFPTRYHHPIDPVSFSRQSIGEIDGSDMPDMVKLLTWARNLRQFCMDNGLKMKPSAGGLAAQLLRDPRFYPATRRKAPALINQKARERLPGNYYELHTEPGEVRNAAYLDMQNSHHHLARRIQFPCANTLHAYGRYSSENPKAWALPGEPRFDRAITSPGMFYVKLAVPHLPPGSFPPPYMEKAGPVNTWIFSNELPMIHELGGQVEAIFCAIVSDGIEEGLNKYAEYALRELDRKADDKAWLKPLLHSAYGVIAGKPRNLEIGWRKCNGGTDDLYPMAGKMLPVKVLKSKHPIEPKIVNALHRGMIEAEQRAEALSLARTLHHEGGEILCIYADSIFVTITQLPLLPEPWKVKVEATNLQFLSATHFMSTEITRLPGVPHTLRESFAPAARTRFADPSSGRPVRADSGSRVFRPTWAVDLPGQVKKQKSERVKNGKQGPSRGSNRQGRGDSGGSRRATESARR